MTEDERRAILARVATGDLTPEAGADLLREGEHGEAGSEVEAGADRTDEPLRVGGPSAPSAPAAPVPHRRPRPPDPARAPRPPGPAAARDERAARVRVVAAAGAVKVIGDPDVAEVAVEGPHRIRREGDTLVVELDHQLNDETGEHADSGERHTAFAFVVGLPGGVRRRVGLGPGPTRPLVVRVNRELAVDVSAQAGKATVRDVRGPLHLQVSAGSMDVEGVHGAVHCSVQAGKLALRGRITADSTVACDAGSAVLHLEEGSDCCVRGTATMGTLDFVGIPRDEASGRLQLGEGRHELHVTVNVGKVRIVGPGAA